MPRTAHNGTIRKEVGKNPEEVRDGEAYVIAIGSRCPRLHAAVMNPSFLNHADATSRGRKTRWQL
jgi:hypothetical protein